MYSDLFSQKSVQDLLTVLPSLPFALWETFYVTVVSTALSLVWKNFSTRSLPAPFTWMSKRLSWRWKASMPSRAVPR